MTRIETSNGSHGRGDRSPTAALIADGSSKAAGSSARQRNRPRRRRDNNGADGVVGCSDDVETATTDAAATVRTPLLPKLGEDDEDGNGEGGSSGRRRYYITDGSPPTSAPSSPNRIRNGASPSTPPPRSGSGSSSAKSEGRGRRTTKSEGGGGGTTTALMHPLRIAAALSPAAAFGYLAATLFLLTLPAECSRIGDGSTRSVDLGFFVALAGLSQLICPIVGMASDRCVHPLGRRRPFLILGTAAGCIGLVAQRAASVGEMWAAYALAFLVVMLALNVVYSSVIALIPDLVPEEQTGVANGIFAFLIVAGSLLGFATFHIFVAANNDDDDDNNNNEVDDDVSIMYRYYNVFLCVTCLLTLFVANERRGLPTTSATEDTGRTGDGGVCCESCGCRDRRWTIFGAAGAAAGSLMGVTWDDVRGAYWVSPSDHHDFFVVTVSRTFYYMGVSVQTFFMYYLHDMIHVRNPEDAVALLSAVGFAAGAVTCYPVGLLSDKLGNGRKPYVFVSCFVLAVGCISLLFCRTVRDVLILCCIVGGANGAYLTMDTSLAVDTLPSREDAARFLGVWGVAGFVGSALGPTVGGPLLYVFGRAALPTSMETVVDDSNRVADDGLLPVPAAQLGSSEYSVVGYAVIFCMAALYFFLSAFSLRWVESSP